MQRDVSILGIDDEEGVRYVLGEIFATQGWTFYGASTVASGLELFRKKSPDIVLIDYHMPGINGVEGVRLLRTFSGSFPIIAFTIEENQKTAEDFLAAGATDIAIKPIKAPDIISRIRLHLRLMEQMPSAGTAEALDKGFSEDTMRLILDSMKKADKDELTVDDVAEHSGLAYQTAHRYLRLLVSKHRAEQIRIYGKVGRPRQLFRLIQA